MNEVRQHTCGDTMFDEYALSAEDMLAGKCGPEMCRGYLVTRVAGYLRSHGTDAIVQPDDDPAEARKGELAAPLLGPPALQSSISRVTDGE